VFRFFWGLSYLLNRSRKPDIARAHNGHRIRNVQCDLGKLFNQGCNCRDQPFDNQRRKTKRHFIDQKVLWPRHQRMADSKHLLLPARHRACDLLFLE
jgi:hypothetical protein